MAKRWGVKNKINKRIAHLKWLLIKNQIPPPWATAQGKGNGDMQAAKRD